MRTNTTRHLFTTPRCSEYISGDLSKKYSIFSRTSNQWQLQSEHQVKKIKSDREGKYTSIKFNAFCENLGLEKQFTVAYSPKKKKKKKKGTAQD